MILNINQLKYFYMSAKLKSITLAAQELMVTPPAVTMQVKQLENTLDLKLMYREGNKIRLTDMGEKIFQKSKNIFQQIEDIEDYLINISTKKTGKLRIGSHQTTAKYVMPRFISKFNELYPFINIILSTCSTNELVKKILNHNIELALMVQKSEETRIKIKKIRSEEILLIAAPDSTFIKKGEITIAQLSCLPLILREEGTAIRYIVNEYFNKFSASPNILMQLSSHHLIKEFVNKDVGLSFLEKFAIREEIKGKTLQIIRIVGGSPKIDIGIGYLREELLSPTAKAFLRMLDEIDFKPAGSS